MLALASRFPKWQSFVLLSVNPVTPLENRLSGISQRLEAVNASDAARSETYALRNEFMWDRARIPASAGPRAARPLVETEWGTVRALPEIGRAHV